MQFASAPADELALAMKEVTDSTFQGNLLPGIMVIFLKAALLASMTLFISTFATSSIFTILMAAAVYFIGHLQATARDYWLAGVDPEWWMRLLAAGVALMFPDLQAFNLTDDIIAGTAVPVMLFTQTALLGLLYTIIYFALASFVFSGREL